MICMTKHASEGCVSCMEKSLPAHVHLGITPQPVTQERSTCRDSNKWWSGRLNTFQAELSNCFFDLAINTEGLSTYKKHQELKGLALLWFRFYVHTVRSDVRFLPSLLMGGEGRGREECRCTEQRWMVDCRAIFCRGYLRRQLKRLAREMTLRLQVLKLALVTLQLSLYTTAQLTLKDLHKSKSISHFMSDI